MSQPIKYWTSRNGGITANKVWAINDASDNSALVAYSDYAALAAENERLIELGNNQMAEKFELKAENERLRKAGDAVHRAIKVSDPALDWAIECWLAAKEGRDAK